MALNSYKFLPKQNKRPPWSSIGRPGCLIFYLFMKMLESKVFLTPLIPDCYVLCTPGIFMNVSLFFLYIFQTVKCYSCQNNDTFEDELKVGINTQNRQGICQGGKDQYTGYNSGDLTDTTGK